ncbi:DUF2382 domain-containing protein [Specibacter sp. NPDC057265]|uniref:DUF2382 domain-containing protein n=1 Tax=Specibacter sp. NPDC057265 TaxID=3346075 RepID=UPI00363C4626
MIHTDNLSALVSGGGNVLDSDGGKIGSIGQIYFDDRTSEPSWVTVKTGLFGTSESFAPLADATQQGDDIVIPYTKDKVKDAPRVAPDGHLEVDEQDQLYSYYGLSSGFDQGFEDDTTGRGNFADTSSNDTSTNQAYDAGTAQGTVGHDTSGPTTDDAMTRSEEQLHVGTQRQEAGRARLRKFVVTENVTTTVPVQHEEVRLEREPITEANAGDALSGPALSEEEHEVILHEERPVVDKETVPVERVRLDTETVVDDQTVSEDVRKEQIELDEDGRTTR